MTDVFISYSRKDKDFVKVLHQALTESKYNAWVDWEDIPLTADWWEEIKSGIERADTFLFVISPDSTESRVCCQELDHAVAHHKRLVPIVRRDGFDTALMRSALRQHNWLFFRDEDEFDLAFQALVKALDTDLDHVKRHTRLLVKAIEWEHHQRNPDLLMRGSELEHTIQWLTQSSGKEPRWTELQLAYVNESRKAELAQRDAEIQRQKKARKAITSALVAAIAGFVVALGLGVMAWRQFQLAETRRYESEANEIDALVVSAQALLNNKQPFDALKESLKAASRLQMASWIDEDLQNRVTAVLHQAIYTTHEHNRFQAHNSYWVTSVAYRPDGNYVASAGMDGTIKLWMPDGTYLATLEGHRAGVFHLTFSPDGQLLASASYDGTVKLWQVKDAQLPTRPYKTLRGHSDRVTSVSFSPDGKRLISGSDDGTLKLWSIDGKELKTFDSSRGIYSLSFSPKGDRVASADFDGMITLWNLEEGAQLSFNAHAELAVVSFSPDGKTLASGSFDGTVKLWDVQGELVEILATLNGGRVSAIAFSPDGQHLAGVTSETGDYNPSIKLWDLDGNVLQEITGHISRIQGLNFSPDGQAIASASFDGTLRFWTLQGEELTVLNGHQGTVNHVTFSPDGQTIASAGDDRTIRLWNLQGQLIKTLERHRQSVNRVYFSPDGQKLLSASDDGTIKIWTTEGDELKTLDGFSDGIHDISIDPNGDRFALAGTDGTANLWTWDGEELETVEALKQPIYMVRFSQDGQVIATGFNESTNSVVKLQNLERKESRTLTLGGFGGGEFKVNGISFSPTELILATATWEGTVQFWNLDGKNLSSFFAGYTGPVRDISFSPDGRTLAATTGGNLRLWNLQGESLQIFEGHDRSIQSISFSPDGRRIASASEDGTVILWNLDFPELVKQGCHWLETYLISHPDTLQDVKSCQTPALLAQAANTLVQQGEDLARRGDLDKAIAHFQQAQQWNPTLSLDPKADAQRFAKLGQAQQLLREGEALAFRGKLEEAIALFQEAQTLDPNLTLDASVLAQQLSTEGKVQQLLQEGRALAEAENIEESIAKFAAAQELDPSLTYNPERKAGRTAAVAVLIKGWRLANRGEIEEAIATYTKAQQYEPAFSIPANAWNSLCWQGSLRGYAAAVMNACEKAVASLPNDIATRDSRGLARALMGSRKGAIEDFQFFVNHTTNSDSKAQRQRWIDALQAGQNPFTPDEMKELLN